MSENLVLTEINIYPIKSLRGISLQKSRIGVRGLELDRRWMLVNKENVFITQRTNPLLSLAKVSVTNGGLNIDIENYGSISFEFKERIDAFLKVKVWDDVCDAFVVSRKVNDYFSSYLGEEVKLVYMPDDTKRRVDSRYAKNEEIVSFADAFPYLLIGEASLNDLNDKLEVKIRMNRFRPNFVVNTSVPFEEDLWMDFSIGSANFEAAKKCARCVVTTIDQSTGKKGTEPLKTLAKYRAVDNKIMFGQNILYKGGNTEVNIGDEVKIVSSRKI